MQVTAEKGKKKSSDWGLLSCLSSVPVLPRPHKTMHTMRFARSSWVGNLDFRLLHKQITGAGWEQTWGFLFCLWSPCRPLQMVVDLWWSSSSSRSLDTIARIAQVC